MYCSKCGKEIPDGESKLCEDCQKSLINEITSDEAIEKEEIKTEKKKTKKESTGKVKEKILRNKFILIIVLLVILIIVLACIFNAKKVGNTIGNIRNYGYATEQNGWIYFLSPNEDSTQVGIFKIKAGDQEQKSKKELLMDEWDILSLNVYNNYLYFIGIGPEAYSEEDELDNKIYRVKTDGTDLEIINDNEFDNDCYEIYVINDSVYYIGTDYNIYKMSLDGKNRELVLDNGTGYLGITDKYIIYNADIKDEVDYVTHIVDLDGENARPIYENTRLYSVNIVGDYIYYTNASKHICRVKVDGTNQEVLYETSAYNMNASGDYIYYLNYQDEANSDYTVCIYKVKNDGSTETPEAIKTLESYSSFIDVVDEWIVYMDYSNTEGFINLVKADGTEEIKVYSLNYEEQYGAQEEKTEETADTTTSEQTDTESTVEDIENKVQ